MINNFRLLYSLLNVVIGGFVRVIFAQTEYFGRIVKLTDTAVYIRFKKDFIDEYDLTGVQIDFQFNRLHFVRQHIAVDHISLSLAPYLVAPEEVFEQKPQLDVQIIGEKCAMLNGNELKWFNEGLDMYQRQAVVNILQGQARPMPYIIYGPPGKNICIMKY